MLFEKPSLRTKLTFDLAMRQMGGASVFLEGPIGVREPLKDVARNLDRWVNGIVARVFAQTTVEGLAQWSSVPVINALSDLSIPARRWPTFRPFANASASPAQRPQARVHRRRQQRRAVADADRPCVWAWISPSAAREGYTPDPEIVSQAEGLAAVSGARHPDYPRYRRGRRRRARRLYRCLGQHGAGAGSRRTQEAPSVTTR